MAIAGFGRSKIPYQMFDLERNAEEARRLTKCERIYHKGQDLAWDGREILASLLEEHGGVHLPEDKRVALERIFAIIMWGEMAAWKISAQLADGLEPLEARMAATSQAFDEARHFYVMHDYLRALGYVPQRMDRAPQALLDMVLQTDNLAHKLLGMQLMIEPIALTIFQTVRELEVEPVLCELMKYFERDEARHVGLGMQYLPSMMRAMNRRELSALLTFQGRLIFWALWENKLLEHDFRVLGIDPRVIIERARKKQMAAVQVAFDAMGVAFDRQRNLPLMSVNAAIELLFPQRAGRAARAKDAWRAFWTTGQRVEDGELAVHGAHRIRTARGQVAEAEVDAEAEPAA